MTLGGSGTVMEDGSDSVDITVTLSRNLVAGEEVTVPLAVSGTGITASDYTIELTPDTSMNTYNTGVTLNTDSPHSASEPAVVFTGHGTNTVQVATLRVTAQQDAIDEGTEALSMGFGSGNRAVMSNLDRASGEGEDGTTPTGTAMVTITDDDSAGLAISETDDDTTVREDGTTTTDTYTIALKTEPTHDVTVTATAGTGVQVAAPGGTAGGIATLTFTTGNYGTAQTVTVTVVDDSTDNPGGGRDVSISHGASSTDLNYTIDSAGTVTARVIDDEATTVILAATAGNIQEGQTKEFTIELGRGLVEGETLMVPLTFSGTAIRGTDYTMTGTSAPGVQYNNLDSGNANVVFTGPESGATATTATITLSATSDSTVERVPETVDIAFGDITNTGLTDAGGVSQTNSLTQSNLVHISDPVPPGVTVSTSSLALTELGAASDVEKTYTIVLDTAPGANVRITVTNEDTNAVAVDTNAGTTALDDSITFTPGGDGSGSGIGKRQLGCTPDGDGAGAERW